MVKKIIKEWPAWVRFVILPLVIAPVITGFCWATAYVADGAAKGKNSVQKEDFKDYVHSQDLIRTVNDDRARETNTYLRLICKKLKIEPLPGGD